MNTPEPTDTEGLKRKIATEIGALYLYIRSTEEGHKQNIQETVDDIYKLFQSASSPAIERARLEGAQKENEIWTRLAVKHQWDDIMHARRNLDIYLGKDDLDALDKLDKEQKHKS